MLTRCPRCGKPVYCQNSSRLVECGYCYNLFHPAGPAPELKPEGIDWKKPIYDEVCRAARSADAYRWLILLGDYEDAPQRLERILTEEPGRLKEGIEKAASSWAIDQLINDLQASRSFPGSEKMLLMAFEKKAFLKEKEAREEAEKAREEAEKARKKKRNRRIGAILAGACFIAFVCYGLWSCFLYQPAQLEKARTFSENEQYPEAEDAYLAITTKILFVNKTVKKQAEQELKELRNQWAEILALQGDEAAAIEKYEAAGNTETATAVRRVYAEELEQQGLLEEAIEQYGKLPDSHRKIQELYAGLAVKALEEGAYELALISYAHSDPEILAAFEITEETINRLWGEDLARQGETDEAIQKLEEAGDSMEVAVMLRDLYVRQADETGRKAIEQWEKDGKRTDANGLQILEETGTGFKTIDAQLRYWQLLAEMGIDLTRVYPEGVEVEGLWFPTETGESDIDCFDVEKPLAFEKREKEYTISLFGGYSLFDIQRNTDPVLHDPEDPSCFTIKMLPELWQQLPEERRAASLEDCTCIFVQNLTYQPDGYYYGRYRMEDLVNTGQSEGLIPAPTKTIDFDRSFPLFTARMELLLWNYPNDGIKVLEKKDAQAKYSDDSLDRRALIVDWTKQKSTWSASTIELGLSGEFDENWKDEAMEYVYVMFENGKYLKRGNA